MTLRSDLCCCKPVYRLSSVTFVRCTQGLELSAIFLRHLYLSYRLTSCKILRKSSRGTLPSGALNARGVANRAMLRPGTSSADVFLLSSSSPYVLFISRADCSLWTDSNTLMMMVIMTM